MPQLSNDEITTIVGGQHAAVIMLMPGTQAICPGAAQVVTEQKIQFSFAGCPKCAVEMFRACIANSPDFAQLVLAAISANNGGKVIVM